MTLPTSRNFTYANGDPPRHVDLNDIQDQIIAIDDEARNGVEVLSPYSGLGGSASSWDMQLGGVILIGGDEWRVPIPMRVGRRIVSVAVRMKEDTGDTCIISVKKVQDGSASTLGTPQTVPTGSSWVTRTVPDVDEVVDADHHYFLSADPSGSYTGVGIVGQVIVTWDRP